MSLLSSLRGRQTQFHIELLYGVLFIAGFAYLVFRIDPRVAAFEGGLVVGYLLRIWEKMSIYERILEEAVSREAEQQVASEVEEQVADEVATEVEDQVGDEVEEQVGNAVEEQVADEVAAEVSDEVALEIEEQVPDEVDDRLSEEIEAAVADKIADIDERLVDEQGRQSDGDSS